MAEYRISTPQGNILVEAPAGASRADVIGIYNQSLAKASGSGFRQRQAATRRELDYQGDLAAQTAANRDKGVLDYLGEVPKGLIGGAAGIVESGALGLAALLPDNAEEVVRSGIQSVGGAVQDYVSPDIGLGDSVVRKLSEAGGSFAGIVGASLVNPIAGGTLAVTAGMGEASERARAGGASADDRLQASLLGIIPGAMELLPVGRLVKGIKQVYKGTAKPVELITNRVGRALREGGIEGAQEVASGIAQNMIEQGYNPTQGTFEGSGEAAGYGGAVGAIAQALIDLATPRKRGGSQLQLTDQREEATGQDDGIAGLLTDQRTTLGNAQAREDIGRMLDSTGDVALGEMQDIVARTGISLPALERIVAEEQSTRGSALAARAQEEIEDELTTPDVKRDPSIISQAVADKLDPQGEARKREEQAALERDDVAAFEQPDLLAKELEAERKTSPEAAARDAARPPSAQLTLNEEGELQEVRKDVNTLPLEGPTKAGQRPRLLPQRQFAGKFDQENLQQTDLLDLIAQEDSAAMRRTRAEAQETDLADRTAAPQVKAAQEAPFRQGEERRKTVVDKVLAASTTSSIVNTEKAIQKALTAAGMPRTKLSRNEKLAVENKVAGIKTDRAPTEFAPNTANEEQFVVPVKKPPAVTAAMVGEPLKGKPDVKVKKTKQKASGDSVSPVGSNVAAEPSGGVSGATDPKARPKKSGASGDSGVGVSVVGTRSTDGAKVGEQATLKPVKRGPIPAGIKGVARKPAPKENNAAKLERLYEEEASKVKKRDYRASDNTVKSNPFSEQENSKVVDKLIKGASKSDKGKKEDAPIIAYLGRYPNPAEGLREAVIDQIDATAQTRSESTDDPTAKRAAALRKDMSGTSTKEQPSPADRAIAWARVNFGPQGNKWLDGQIEEAEANKGRRQVITSEVEASIDAMNAPLVASSDILADSIDSGYIEAEDSRGKKREDSRVTLSAGVKAKNKRIIDLALETDAVVGLDLPLDVTVTDAIADGDLGDVLLNLAKITPSRQVRQLATAFAGVVGTTKLVTTKNLKAEDGRSVAGLFDPKTNTISLDQDAGINTHTLMHEMSHAVTSADIANPKSSTGQQFNRLFNDVKEYLGTVYGSKNADEFLAEAQSNPLFRAELAGINIKGEEVSALQRYFNIMNNILSRYVPFIKSRNITILQEVDSFVDGLLAPAPQYRYANQMAMMSTAEGVKKFARTMIDKTQETVSKGSRKQWGYDARDMLGQQGFKGTARRLLLGLADSQGVADIARSVGFAEMGQRLDDLITNQRGAIQTADAITEARIESILKTLNQGTQEQVQKRIETLNDIIYSTEYGATIYQVDPTKERNAYMTSKGEAKFDADGNNLLEVYDTLRKLWTSKEFGPEGRKAFNDMRDTYRNQYDKLREVVMGQIDSVMVDSPEARQLKNKIFSQLFDRSTLDVYFPLMREGDFVLKFNAKDKDLEGKRRGTVVQTFTTAAERDDAALMIRADSRYKDVETSDGAVTASTFRNSADAGFAAETIGILDKAKDKDGNALPTEIKDQIMQLYVKALPETSFAKSLQKRKGYPGYMQDSILALKTKGYSLASQTAKLEYGAKLRQFRAELNDKDLWGKPRAIPEANSLVGRGAKAVTASFDDVKMELNKRAEFAQSGAKTGNFEAVARRLNQTAFVYTIGFNASSALVNLSQIPLFVTPYLAGKYDSGYKDSFVIPKTRAALAKAYGNTLYSGKRGGKVNSIRTMYDISATGEFTLKADLKLPEGKAAEFKRMAALVQTASNRGLLGQGYIAEAMGLNEAGRVKKGTRLGNALDNVSVFSAFLFNHAEQLNRQVTLMASFDLALNKETNNAPQNATEAQIEKAVKEAIYDTQQTNGGTFLETAPRFARQGVGRVAFMYKSYGLRMYHSMFQTAKVAFDSDKGKLFGPEGSDVRRAAWKQLIGMHGAALFFAGVQGVPLYGAVRLMTNLLFLDEEEEDFDTIVRKYIGEGWYKGAITKFSGVDVASRMALTGLLVQENRFNSDPSLEETIGFYGGGPALSIANRLYRGTKDLANGEFLRGVENILPAGVANAYKSTFGRYAQEGGIYTRRGDPIYDDMSVGELAAQALGFPPSEYTFRQEQNRSSKGIDIAVNKKRSALTKKLYIAQQQDDPDSEEAARREIEKFNARHPEAEITPEAEERSLKQHRKTTEKMRKYNGISISSTYNDKIDDLRADWGQ